MNKETYTLKEIEEKLEHEKYLREENQQLYEELQVLRKCSDTTNDLANEYKKELERYKNIIKNIKEEIELYIDVTIDHFETINEEINFELRNKCRAMREIKSEILEIIEKELKGE